MDADRESLLTPTDRGLFSSSNKSIGLGNSPRWRRNVLVIVISLLLAICLTVYFYLNMEVIDGIQDAPDRFKPLSRRKPILDHESIFSGSGPSMIRLSDLLAHCIVALRVAGQEIVDLSLVHNDKLKQVGSKGKTLEGVDDVVTGADLKSHHIILRTIKDSYRRLTVVSEEDSTQNFDSISADNDILPMDRTKFAKLIRNNLHEIENKNTDWGSLIAQHETLVWIDPLDATKEYSENLTNYVTLMACIVHKSIPIAGVIYQPFSNRSYWSMKNVNTGEYHHSPDLSRALAEAQFEQSSNGIRIIVSRSHAGNVKSVVEGLYGERAHVISAGGSGYKTLKLIQGEADAYMHLTRIKKWDICAPDAILSSIPGGNLTDLAGKSINFGNPKDQVVDSGLVASLNRKVFSELLVLTRNFKGSGEKPGTEV